MKEDKEVFNIYSLSYCEEDIFKHLNNPEEKDVIKVAYILKLESIDCCEKAFLFLSNLTGHDGKVREACAFKFFQFISNENYCKYFQNEKCYEIILKGIIDINPNVCRIIIDCLKFLEDKAFFKREIERRLALSKKEYKKLLNRTIQAKKSYQLNKFAFAIYWDKKALEMILN